MPLAAVLGISRRFLASNAHVVEPGRAFRVARGHLPDEALVRLLHRRGIRTLIDLRDPASSAADLSGISFESLGVRFRNVHLRASVLPPPRAVEEFVRLVSNPLSGPFLFLCKRGKDKTGFASALYRATVCGDTPDAAWASQLRFVPFGHRARTHPGPWVFKALFAASGRTDLRSWCLSGYADAYHGAAAARAHAFRGTDPASLAGLPLRAPLPASAVPVPQ